MKKNQDKTSQDRQFVDSIARAFSILEALSRANHPLGNGELSRLVDLPPSTVSRLTYTLTKLGYLRRTSHNRCYELTPKTLTIGYSILESMSILDRVRPYLNSISMETGETAAIALQDKLHITFVEVQAGTNLLAVRLATGGRLRIPVSAAGIAILAALPKRQQWSLAQRLLTDLEERNESSHDFLQALNACYDQGYAIVRNSWMTGIGGISTPIEWQGHLAALTIPVSTGGISMAAMQQRLAPILLEAAREIGSPTIHPVMRGQL